MFGSFGWMELMLILIIVLIIFGAGKLPQLGEGLGKAIKGFKKSVHEAEALEGAVEEEAPVRSQEAETPAQPAPPSQGQGQVPKQGQAGEADPGTRPGQATEEVGHG